MAGNEIIFELRDGLATITLNRPEKLNSMTTELFLQLEACVAKIEAAPEQFGCVVLRGAGPCFSAGNDLKQIHDGDALPYPNFQSLIIERLGNLPIPVIAAVHGHCYTGALELALSSDIILASSDAKFADTHGKWGMVPIWGMSQRLPRRVGRARAAEMMFTSRTYTGEEAAAIGLANACFPAERFDAEVAAFCDLILKNSWFSHRGNKSFLRDTEGMDLASGLAHEIVHHPGLDPQMNERIAAFLSKKKPLEQVK